jgi:hypothetical protein
MRRFEYFVQEERQNGDGNYRAQWSDLCFNGRRLRFFKLQEKGQNIHQSLDRAGP